jgi:hypothetical protein
VQDVDEVRYGDVLADAVAAALPGWVERAVVNVLMSRRGAVTEAERASAATAGALAGSEVGERLRALLRTDVDQQSTNPLALLRGAVRYPTEVLAAAGVAPVRRDEFKQRAFPDDVYDLVPATWVDIDESLLEPGLVWGAWKAKVILDRRRAEGRR